MLNPFTEVAPGDSTDVELAEGAKNGNRAALEKLVLRHRLAGRGQGDDANKLSDKERARWRRQALEWLRQDLNWWAKALDHGTTNDNNGRRPAMAQAVPERPGARWRSHSR